MNYISTRGAGIGERHTFSDILLGGLAKDGGLYLPSEYPRVSADELARWRALPYADLAFEILAKFCDDIPADDLRAITRRTYTADVYRHTRHGGNAADITPLTTLGAENGAPVSLLELSNGPTLAFKDMAMQLLGNLFEYTLAAHGETLNILGATSGDTGSAAEYAMRGKRGVRVFMLSPHRKMSAFQTAQMYSLQDPNIFNLAVEGVFDDCQDIVKAVSNDHAFKAQQKIGTVNSINWARVVAQVVYYFKGYFAATRTNDERVSFTVPSGNFGNVCAGHIARMMGLPIEKLVVATNENDVLDEFFRTGAYRVRSAEHTYHTSSPSMDISKASNFERFVFDLLGRDPARVVQLFRDVEQRRLRSRGERRFRARRRVRLRVGPQHARGPARDDPRRVRALSHDDRHAHGRRPESGARASAAGRADDRARDRAADQVRRNDSRGARAGAVAARRVRRARGAAAALRGGRRERAAGEGLHRRAHGRMMA